MHVAMHAYVTACAREERLQARPGRVHSPPLSSSGTRQCTFWWPSAAAVSPPAPYSGPHEWRSDISTHRLRSHVCFTELHNVYGTGSGKHARTHSTILCVQYSIVYTRS